MSGVEVVHPTYRSRTITIRLRLHVPSMSTFLCAAELCIEITSTVDKRVVRILLECCLVNFLLTSESSQKTKQDNCLEAKTDLRFRFLFVGSEEAWNEMTASVPLERSKSRSRSWHVTNTWNKRVMKVPRVIQGGAGRTGGDTGFRENTGIKPPLSSVKPCSSCTTVHNLWILFNLSVRASNVTFNLSG